MNRYASVTLMQVSTRLFTRWQPIVDEDLRLSSNSRFRLDEYFYSCRQLTITSEVCQCEWKIWLLVVCYRLHYI